MKKTTTMQALFDVLPTEMLAECPIEADEADEATVDRVWQKTANECGVKKAGGGQRRRVRWLIPAVAVLLVITIVTASAMVRHWFEPTYSFQPPVISVEPIVPLVERYEHAVDVDVVTEHDGVRVTLDKYVLDTVDGAMRLLIHVETTDGTPLTELSAERMSQIVRSHFKKVTLSCEDLEDEAITIVNNVNPGFGNGFVTRRSDAGNEPTRATFECRYYYNEGDGKDLVGKTFTLAMTDFRDEVEVTKDIGFTYESMKALYEDMTPAEREEYVKGSVRISWADGTCDYYHSLCETDQMIRFSTAFDEAYIDNIGFNTELSRDYDSELYVSFVGLDLKEKMPVLLDTRNGGVHYGVRDPECNGERVTMIYHNITPDMLPFLFMMQEQGFEHITRAKGEWELSFTAEQPMAVRGFDIDADLHFHEYAYHVTRVEMTDCSLYFDGEYAVTPPSEGETTYASIYGTIDLVLADGTVLENPFYQGPSADIHEVCEGSGTTRWGGEFLQFIDTSQVVAVTALGETIPLV